jgi:threonine dehydratase
VSVAAALAAQYPQDRVCAVVSGGNIDADTLAAILQGRTP